MKTTENNKLIAEFMERETSYDFVDVSKERGDVMLSKALYLDQEGIDGEVSHYEDRYAITPEVLETPLEYHTSWDWLMPVVEKIEQTVVIGAVVDVVIERDFCIIKNGEMKRRDERPGY
jgi:hypothetical protein